MLEMAADNDDDWMLEDGSTRAYKRVHQWPNSGCYDQRMIKLANWGILVEDGIVMKHMSELINFA